MKVAIGGFDGMHKAHMELINRADSYLIIEKNSSLTPGFDRVEYSPKILDILNLKEIKHLTQYQFIELLKQKYRVKEIIVGEDFRFGKDRQGDILTLKEHFKVEVIREIKLNSTPIHSRTIREYLKTNFNFALKLLNHSYKIKATQIKGQGIGQEQLFPTINLSPIKNYLVPQHGIYISKVNNLKSITFIGKRSTDNNFSIETHILEEFKHSNLYKLELLYFIHEPKKYKSLKELKKSITEDIEFATNYFNTHSIYK